MSSDSNKGKISKRAAKLKTMIAELDAIIEAASNLENKCGHYLKKVHPEYIKSATNLLHYRALRSRDLRSLQKKLGYMGLSRLAQSQSHVMASLQTNRSILQAILDKAPLQMPDNELSFKKGEKALKSNAKKLLGYRTKSRRTRIMVTMPTAAADDYEMVSEMLKAGMNCARINCAHDNPDTWEKINANVRRAAMELGKKCKVAMDLAGPKIRTGPIAEGPRVMKIKPPKNISGKIKKPLDIWLGTALKPGFLHVPISQKSINILEGDETLFFRDASGKKRSFNLLEKQEGGFVAQCKKTTFIYEGMPLFTNKEMDGTPVEIGGIAPVQMPILLKPGDLLRLDKEPLLGEAAVYGTEGEVLAKAHISCTEPIIFDQVKPGERILFDDGKIEGIIKKTDGESILVEVTHIPKGTAKLRAEKGINFPDSQLTISGLTEKDKKDLPFIAAHADVVNFSFVNRPEDVRELLEELEKIGAKDKLGIILKIETQDGYNHLTEILLEAMQTSPVGVMIARGDLAVETGWDNIGRIQEEILSLCEAAHVTDIWATQVLENLAKKGIPSRSEITDATMAQRADCVMLNKGPYILEAIRLLDNILSDMEFYWEKNMPLSPMMDGQIKAQL